MEMPKTCSRAVYKETDINKDVLKNVFLHGETHADTSIFPIDSQDVVSSYDTASIYENYMN